MDEKELKAEIERIDAAAARGYDHGLLLGLIARGVWQVALQLARLNDVAETAAILIDREIDRGL